MKKGVYFYYRHTQYIVCLIILLILDSSGHPWAGRATLVTGSAAVMAGISKGAAAVRRTLTAASRNWKA
jgi:hypothetical protein